MMVGQRKAANLVPSGTGTAGIGTCRPPSETVLAHRRGEYLKDSGEELPWKKHKQKLEMGLLEKRAPNRAHTNPVNLEKERKDN